MSVGFSLGSQNHLKGDELKTKLLECLKAKNSHLSGIAKEFYEKHSSFADEDYTKLCKEIVACVDEILTNGNWEDSLFLRNSLKPLKSLREQAVFLLKQMHSSINTEAEKEQVVSEDRVLLYISLYQQDGLDMKKWELQLKSIECYLAGRPVYSQEEEVKKMLRLKLAQTSEAYIVITAKKSAIQNDSFHPKRLDRCGNTLVNIAAGTLTANDISEFVHQGRRYRFVDGKLILKKAS